MLCCNFCGNCYKDEKELAHHVFEKHENNGNSTGTDSELEMMTAGSQGKPFVFFKIWIYTCVYLRHLIY